MIGEGSCVGLWHRQQVTVCPIKKHVVEQNDEITIRIGNLSTNVTKDGSIRLEGPLNVEFPTGLEWISIAS